jgi:phosphoglucosamine mutase
MRKLFGTDGIRGIAGEAPLDRGTIFAVGVALARSLEDTFVEPRIIVGSDTRESSAWIVATIAAGLLHGGASVIHAGVVTTPAIAYLTRKHEFAAGVVISASHNPWQDNGIKVFGSNGYKLPDALELSIEEGIFSLLAKQLPTDGLEEEPLPPVDAKLRLEYEAYLRAAVPGLRLDGMSIVVDCANGAASEIAQELFSELGGSIHFTHVSPNGRNINADCGALHPEIVAKEVLAVGADMGVTFDGDADRALFADAKGRVVNGDGVLLMTARDLKNRAELKHDVVVATTMSNMGLEAALRADGIRMMRAPVGDKYVLQMMQDEDASLGGEQSGHILFPAKATTGDGLLTALLVLDLVKRSGKALHELVADLKVYPQVILNVRVREKKPLEGIASVVTCIKAAEEELHGNGRVVIRYSGTEALARVMIEAESEEQMQRHADAIADAIRSEIGI